jgi:protein involved in polysaccharide export with SLBB domain
MGKRSGLLLAILLILSIAQVKMPVAAAQSAGSDTLDCPSGVISSVDGSCVGEDESSLPGLGQQGNQQGNPQGNPQGGGFGGSVGTSGPLSTQYPGLQSQGMNGRIPEFRDQGGLITSPAQLESLQEARSLAFQSVPPPTDFQLLVRGSLGRLLPVYGDSLFRQQVPTTFAPIRNANVTSNYVLGPGDQLIIRIWGQVDFNAQLTVDRSGAVYLPQVGEIHVAGLPYSQVQQHIRDAVSHIYKSFDLEVEMGQLRSIQVFVVGQARRPGTYTLSSLSTLVTALFATGGPSVQGSLRDIQLRRNGETVSHFDLYDLLIFGDMSKDAPLLPGDVIYIPPVGPQVGIAGEVRVPAIYELKGPTSVDQALKFAGGLASTASLLRASLERLDAHTNRTVLDVSLQGAGLATPLQPADLIRVLPISPQFQNTVTLRGNVAEPGRFSWHPGMKLSDIIPDSQSLIVRDYWERRNRLGIPGPDFKPEYASNPDYFPRNSGGYQTGTPQFDSRGVPIFNPPNSLNPYPSTQQNGVQNSNQYPNQNPNQNSDQNSNQAYNPNCVPSTNTTQTQGLGIFGAASGLSIPQNTQQPCIPNTGDNNDTGTGSRSSADQELTSNVNSPRPPLTVMLPVPEIDWSYAVIERMDPQTLTTSLVPFNPGQLILSHDASQNLPLDPGDVVTVFSQADIRVPQAERTKFVRLEGEFKHAGIYSVLPGETLPQLIERAGGLTPAAYLFGSNFTRESTRVLQQLRLNDYLQNLELEIDRATIAASASVGTADPQAVAASRSLVARFRSIRATGRIVLNIPLNATIGSLPNMPLEDGDRFVVPSKPSTVNVVGAVYDQNSFLFKRTEEVKGYLRLAGGPTQSADSKDSFIIRADGSVVSKRSQSGVFGNTFESSHLEAGDTVIIPEKVPRPSALRNFINYTQIFSQLALGAAAIAVLQ